MDLNKLNELQQFQTEVVDAHLINPLQDIPCRVLVPVVCTDNEILSGSE